VIHLDKAHGADLERIGELHGVTRFSVWEPEKYLVHRVTECWRHWGSYATQLRPDPPRTAWWAPIEWVWWRAVSWIRRGK
jgi:hypothetical protein